MFCTINYFLCVFWIERLKWLKIAILWDQWDQFELKFTCEWFGVSSSKYVLNFPKFVTKTGREAMIWSWFFMDYLNRPIWLWLFLWRFRVCCMVMCATGRTTVLRDFQKNTWFKFTLVKFTKFFSQNQNWTYFVNPNDVFGINNFFWLIWFK